MRNCSQKVSIALALTMAAAFAVAGGNSKIETQTETHEERIQPGVRYEFSRTVGAGRLVRAQEGRDGVLKKTFRVTYKDGRPVAKELLKEERIQAEPTILLMGKAGYPVSRGSYDRAEVRTMIASAYDPSPQTIGRGATGRTRMGYIATFGQVAVDPRVIKLGSLLYVEGYGFALASDTGGAIKGNRIDLCYDSRAVSERYGMRKVRVHIFKRN